MKRQSKMNLTLASRRFASSGSADCGYGCSETHRSVKLRLLCPETRIADSMYKLSTFRRNRLRLLGGPQRWTRQVLYNTQRHAQHDGDACYFTSVSLVSCLCLMYPRLRPVSKHKCATLRTFLFY